MSTSRWLPLWVVLWFVVMWFVGCGGGAARQTTDPRQIVGDGGTATQTVSSEQWVTHALDAARERIGMAGLRMAAIGAALLMLAGAGWSLLLLNLDAPTGTGKLRAALVLIAVGLLTSPLVVVLVLLI